MNTEFTEFFNYFNFREPNIVEYHKNKVDIFIRDKSNILRNAYKYPDKVIKYADGGGELFGAELFVNGEQWLRQFLPTVTSVGGVFSHYWLARGHTITTGLGLGIRENWLSNKREITKLTVLEKSLKLIDYHKEHNPDLFDRAEIIHADANEYVGECDVLLMDHYEEEGIPEMAKMSSKVSKNINCEVCWFWPLEELIQDCLVVDVSSCPTKMLDGYVHQTQPTQLEAYEYIKKTYDLPKLPELKEDTINLFLYTYNKALA